MSTYIFFLYLFIDPFFYQSFIAQRLAQSLRNIFYFHNLSKATFTAVLYHFHITSLSTLPCPHYATLILRTNYFHSHNLTITIIFLSYRSNWNCVSIWHAHLRGCASNHQRRSRTNHMCRHWRYVHIFCVCLYILFPQVHRMLSVSYNFICSN